MIEKTEFTVKINDHDWVMTLTYDKWGGMRIIRKASDERGRRKYEEIYLPKEAMVEIAYQLLKKECCK